MILTKVLPLCGRKDSFQQMVLEKLDVYVQKNEIGPFLIPRLKINTEWIKNLYANQKSTEEKHMAIFLYMTEKAQATKETNISIGHYQNLSFCVKFKTIKRVERQSTEWDKVFANP